MTKTKKPRKLAREILVFILLCAGISLVQFMIISRLAGGVAESYCFYNDIYMTEFDWIALDRWIFGISAVLSCLSFTVLFLLLLEGHIAYIRKITWGIASLRTPEAKTEIPLEGNDELTSLAAAINDMSRARQELREKELALSKEKEELIRSLSHDIRTPLTSILAYSDYLAQGKATTHEEEQVCLQLIRKKAEQIKELTAILLDGSRRTPEFFEKGKLLLEQMALEFEEELEDKFTLSVDFSACPDFSGSFDLQELRRVFDNLSSNIQKYADPTEPVCLKVSFANNSLEIHQSNAILTRKPESESYRIGISSIRRIAQLYGGSALTEEKDGRFTITITFSNL